MRIYIYLIILSSIISCNSSKKVEGQTSSTSKTKNEEDLYFECKKNDLSYIISSKGDKIGNALYKTIIGYNEGFFTVQNKDLSFSIIDVYGNIITNQRCEYLGVLKDGFARIKKNRRWYFINKSGVNVFNITFNEVKDFHNDFAPVKNDKYWTFINKKGNLISKYKFNKVQNFENGLAVVVENSKYGFINENGDYICNPIFYMAHSFKENGFGRVQITDYYQTFKLINKDGEIFPKNKNIFVTSTGFNNDGLLEVCKIDDVFKAGLIDKNENEVIPIKYDRVSSFLRQKYYPVFKIINHRQKCGIVDLSNKLIIPFNYTEINGFDTNGFSIATKLYKKGKTINYSVSINNTIKSYTTTADEDVFGVIDLNNNTIVPFKYKTLFSLFLNSTDLLKYKSIYIATDFSNKVGVINGKNKTIIPFNYEHINYISNGVFFCKKSNSIDIYNIINNKITNFSDKNISMFFGKARDSYLLYKNNNKYGILDFNKKILIKNEYDLIKIIR